MRRGDYFADAVAGNVWTNAFKRLDRPSARCRVIRDASYFRAVE